MPPAARTSSPSPKVADAHDAVVIADGRLGGGLRVEVASRARDGRRCPGMTPGLRRAATLSNIKDLGHGSRFDGADLSSARRPRRSSSRNRP